MEISEVRHLHNPMLATALHDLIELMRQRVRLTYDVARWKWNHTAPIDHHAREEMILDAVEQLAQQLSLPVSIARQFFRDQIEASKVYQRVQFERWSERERKEFKTVPDLHSSQRRDLDALTKPLLLQFGIVLSLLHDESAPLLVQSLRIGVEANAELDTLISSTACATLLHYVQQYHTNV